MRKNQIVGVIVSVFLLHSSASIIGERSYTKSSKFKVRSKSALCDNIDKPGRPTRRGVFQIIIPESTKKYNGGKKKGPPFSP